jgi:hypothetical protein
MYANNRFIALMNVYSVLIRNVIIKKLQEPWNFIKKSVISYFLLIYI